MKRILFFCILATIFALGTFLPLATAHPLVSVIRDGIRFSESVYPYDGGLFISNFGSETMSPLHDENAGYILYRKDGITKTIIPANGSLHKPTAMAVKDGHLFICDETRLVVHRLDGMAEPPQIVTFPAEDQVVNALALDGDTLYISLTNPGSIYSLDVSHPANVGSIKPQKWLDIHGANGMAVGDGVMYIATIPTDYSTISVDDVIYCVRDMKHLKAEKFCGEPGLYDGVALSDDNKTLYISEWKTGTVTAVDVQTKRTHILYEEQGIGPADIAQAGGILFIPDLPNSRVIEINVEDIQNR